MSGTDLVPFVSEADIESAADPVGYVVLACERAKTWLAQALEHGDIESIVEIKSQAEAIRVYTQQKELGHDAELSAQEIVRRAERGIGVCIRRGQEAGEITDRSTAAQQRESRARGVDNTSSLARPTDFAKPVELSGNQAGIYALTDEVSNEKFDQAITEAKAEGNLSRANVVRKVKGIASDPKPRNVPEAKRIEQIADLAETGMTGDQIGSQIGTSGAHVRAIARRAGITISAETVVGRRRRIDGDRVVRELVASLEGLCSTLPLITISDLDAREIDAWADSLKKSLRFLNQFSKELTQA